MMQYYRDRARRASAMIEKVQNENTVKEATKAFKNRSGLEELNPIEQPDDNQLQRWKM